MQAFILADELILFDALPQNAFETIKVYLQPAASSRQARQRSWIILGLLGDRLRRPLLSEYLFAPTTAVLHIFGNFELFTPRASQKCNGLGVASNGL